jgi:hypothetical protein
MPCLAVVISTSRVSRRVRDHADAFADLEVGAELRARAQDFGFGRAQPRARLRDERISIRRR